MRNPKAPQKNKMTNSLLPLCHLPSSPSLSSIPDEIVVSLLARISKSYYSSLCLVSKSFYSLLSSPEIYAARSGIGATEPRLYVCLRLPTAENNRWFTLMNPEEGELSLAPVRDSSYFSPARSKSTTVAVGFEIYQIGGSISIKRSKAVRVLDCRSHKWRRGPNLTVARKHAKSCFLDGKIYVIGGENKSMLSGEVFDIKTQTWKPMPSPKDVNGVDSNYQVILLGTRIHVITKHSNYAYDTKEGRWLPYVGFDLDLQILSISITGPCCVIENVMIAEIDGKLKWYNTSQSEWIMVCDLGSLYANRARIYRTIQLVNHGGKLVIIWHESNKILDGRRFMSIQSIRSLNFTQDKGDRIWCALIRLEKHLTDFGPPQICGEIERCNVVLTVPKSSKLLSCLSVSV